MLGGMAHPSTPALLSVLVITLMSLLMVTPSAYSLPSLLKRSAWRGPQGHVEAIGDGQQTDFLPKTDLYPTSRLIIIILTEQCYALERRGVKPLPSYCSSLTSGLSTSYTPDILSPADTSILNGYYDNYRSSVSDGQLANDLSRAEQAEQTLNMHNMGNAAYNQQ